LSPRRRWLVLACCLVLLLGTVWGAVRVLSAGSTTDASGSAPQGSAGPVLLVAGYGGSTSSMERLAVVLRSLGRMVQVVPVGDGTGDLRIQARQLARVADRSLRGGAPSVDVIGYSAGGVVARIWADELGGARQARRVVTLGSPHHGAEVAGFAAALAPASCPLACRQLAPGSTLLAALGEAAAGPRWVSIWSGNDTVVTPPQSSRLQGAVNVELQAVCPAARVSHGQLPTDPLAVALVERALSPGGLAAVPAPAACGQLGGVAG
jgi:triacylglycerol lipase